MLHKHKHKKDWTARVLLECPDGIIFVRKPGGPWGFPGGKKNPQDKDPKATAKRECREESGVEPRLAQLKLLEITTRRVTKKKRWAKVKHFYRHHFFHAVVTADELEHCFPISREGEEVCIVSRSEAYEMENISPNDRKMAERHGLWRT